MPFASTRPLSCTRRQFLAGGLGALAVGGLSQAAAPPRPPLLDLHVHLFGVGDNGTGCRMAKEITNGLQFIVLTRLLRLHARAKTLDEGYELALVEHLAGSGLNKAAIVAQDAVYSRDGKPDWNQTKFYVPNDHLFAVTARHADAMLPCPSINPNRGDALEELARCHEKGAKLFKIHPPTQGVDVSERKHAKFFRRCKELGMIVLVHTGHEHSAPVIDIHLATPKKLELALDQGCTVVACHAGSGWETDRPDQLPAFLEFVKKYESLWGDTAVLGTARRGRDFRRLLDDPLARSRLLHGSDFPFPANPGEYVDTIGKPAVARIGMVRSWVKMDYDLKEALGIGEASARRAYQLVRGGRGLG